MNLRTGVVFVTCGFFLLLTINLRSANADLFVSNNGMSFTVAAFGSDLGSVLNCPLISRGRGLVSGNDGFLYVVSNAASTTSRVVRFDLETGVCEDFIDPNTLNLTRPKDILLDANGGFLVAGFVDNSVKRFDSTGAFLGKLVNTGGGGLNGPEGMCFGPLGTLLVVSRGGNEVIEYNPVSGAMIRSFVPDDPNAISHPVGVAIGPDENIYVSSRNTNSIHRFDSVTGQDLGAFVIPGSGGLTDPFGIAFGDDGLLYVCSNTTDRIFRFCDQTGAFVDIFAAGGDVSGPYFLTFLPNSTITQPTLLIRLNMESLAANLGDPLIITGSLLNGNQPENVFFFVNLRKPDGSNPSFLPGSFQGIQPVLSNVDLEKTVQFGNAGAGCLQLLGTYAFVTRIVSAESGNLLSYSLNHFEVVP